MCGFHIYQDVWTPVLGKFLAVKRDDQHRRQVYHIAVYKSEEVGGHVPCKISCLWPAFISDKVA